MDRKHIFFKPLSHLLGQEYKKEEYGVRWGWGRPSKLITWEVGRYVGVPLEDQARLGGVGSMCVANSKMGVL